MHAMRALLLAFAPGGGRWDEARILRINPRDPRTFFAYANLANAHLAARDYAKGLEWARRATGAAPDYGEAYLYTAALYVGPDNIDKAKSALERARALAPEYIQHLFQMRSRTAQSDPRKTVDGGAELRRRFHIFLRIAAGLEDPAAAAALR